MRTAFFTDVEGNLAYFTRYLRMSRVLSSSASPTTGALTLDFRHRDTRFVFGGDCFDKGSGDLRIAEALVDLKTRYPSRCYILIGNRDMNKMKLSSELDEADLARPPENIPGPYWIAGSQGVTYASYLAKRGTPNNAVSKLKWLLRHTMGCEKTFEHRRVELGGLGVTDTAVVDSFLQSIQPNGVVARYLAAGQVALHLDDALFVHGSVNDVNLGFVPSYADGVSHDYHHAIDVSGATYNNVPSWVSALNAFGRHGVEEWRRRPTWDAARMTRGGMALMGYGYSASIKHRTVMTTNFLRNGSPAYLSETIQDYMRRSGVRRIFSGHQPYGDSPGIIRHKDLHVVMGDISFSDAEAPDNRGVAVTEVLLDPDGTTTIHGTLADGTSYDFPVADPLGMERDGWWAKARLGTQILSSRSKDGKYQLEYKRENI